MNPENMGDELIQRLFIKIDETLKINLTSIDL